MQEKAYAERTSKLALEREMEFALETNHILGEKLKLNHAEREFVDLVQNRDASSPIQPSELEAFFKNQPLHDSKAREEVLTLLVNIKENGLGNVYAALKKRKDANKNLTQLNKEISGSLIDEKELQQDINLRRRALKGALHTARVVAPIAAATYADTGVPTGCLVAMIGHATHDMHDIDDKQRDLNRVKSFKEKVRARYGDKISDKKLNEFYEANKALFEAKPELSAVAENISEITNMLKEKGERIDVSALSKKVDATLALVKQAEKNNIPSSLDQKELGSVDGISFKILRY